VNRWTPCKRREFIRRLLALGFEGPFSGARHQFMVYREHRLAIPSNDEFSTPQLRMIREVEVVLGRSLSARDWNEL
jgi:hypothetical protein